MENIIINRISLLLLSYISSQVDSVNTKTFINAKANYDFTNTIINDVTPTQTITGENLVRCGTACLEDIYCVSYFFNSRTKVCKLFEVDFTNSSQGTYEVGWNYFTAVRDCMINGQECPVSDGYIFYEQMCMCYKYIPIQSVFADAEQYCREHEQGQLVKIDRMLKHMEIDRFLDTVPKPVQPNGDVYIQGKRIDSSDKWYFDNGLEMHFFLWNKGNNQPELREGENVIAVQKVWGKVWHDTMETASIMFICEKVL